MDSCTLQVLADRIGVSKMTVSNALRGAGRVSPALRRRIQRMASTRGYVPDPVISAGMAQMRRSSSTRFKSTIAFLEAGAVPDLTLKFPAYGRFYAGVQKRAASLGYGVDRFWLGDPDLSPARLKKILLSRGIQGVIILHLVDDPSRAEIRGSINFDFASFACASLGFRLPGINLHCAMSDHYALMEEGLRQCLAKGYQRICVNLPPAVDATVEHRLSRAYYGYMQGRRGATLPILFMKTDDAPDRIDHLRRYLVKYRPDALLGFTKIDAVEAAGYRVPRDVALFSLDSNPGEFGMDQLHDEVGMAAVDLVIGQMNRRETGPPLVAKAVLIEGIWRNAKPRKCDRSL